jgi:hypothetical protein
MPAVYTPFLIENHGKVDLYEERAVYLDGGAYHQIKDASPEPATTFWPKSLMRIPPFYGLNQNQIPEYAFSIAGGRLVVYEGGGDIRVPTDAQIYLAKFEFYSPGSYSRAVGNPPVIQQGLSSFTIMVHNELDGTDKELLIKDSEVSLLDYAPAGRYISATQAGGLIHVQGKLKLDGTTMLSIRADFVNGIDKLTASNSVTMSGNSLQLALDIRNSAGFEQRSFENFVSGQSLNSPANPFGGGITYFGDGGWTAVITPDDDSLDIFFM